MVKKKDIELSALLDNSINSNIKNLKKIVVEVSKNREPEAVHDMRVTTRRLREAVKVCGDLNLVDSKHISAKFKKLFKALGKKRDLDIFSAFVTSRVDAQSPLSKKLKEQIDKAQKHIITAIKSAYFTKLLNDLNEIKAVKSKEETILKLSIKRLQKALKNVHKIATSINSKTDDKTLHQLRISIKKLRYLCELLEPYFKSNIFSLNSLIDESKNIQTILGYHQDAIIGMNRLKHYKKELTAKELKGIREDFEKVRRDTRHSFFKAWKSKTKIEVK